MDVIDEDQEYDGFKTNDNAKGPLTKSDSDQVKESSAVWEDPNERFLRNESYVDDEPEDDGESSFPPNPAFNPSPRFSVTSVSLEAGAIPFQSEASRLEQTLEESSEPFEFGAKESDGDPDDELDATTLILDPSALDTLYPSMPIEQVKLANGSSVKQQNLPPKKDSENKSSSKKEEEVFNISANVREVPGKTKPVHKKAKKGNANYDPFTMQGLFASLVSMLLFVLDYGSDIAVAVSLNNETGDTFWWFTLTIILIVVPSVIVSLFSLVWFGQDHKLHKKGTLPRKDVISGWERFTLIVCHILCIGPLVREFYIIRAGFKERKKNKQGARLNILGPYCLNPKVDPKDANAAINYYSMRKYYERDAAYLGLIDSFIQDAPQLVLQLYILSVRVTLERADTTTAVLQIFSVVMSLLSLSWAMISYESASRWADPEKPNISSVGNVVQFLWRLLMMASRVLVLSSFASVYPHELFIFGAAHWVLMAIWIFLMKTNFCGSVDDKRRPSLELIYNMVVGWVLIFDVIHVKEGPTRLKQAAYYVIMLLEMTALLFLWYFEINKEGMSGTNWIHQEWYQISLLSFVPASFIVGLIFMAIFYTCYHPGGKMPAKKQKATFF